MTANGRPVALLTPLDEKILDQELELRRRTRALLVLERIQQEAAERGADKLTDEDIEAEISAVRASGKQTDR